MCKAYISEIARIECHNGLGCETVEMWTYTTIQPDHRVFQSARPSSLFWWPNYRCLISLRIQLEARGLTRVRKWWGNNLRSWGITSLALEGMFWVSPGYRYSYPHGTARSMEWDVYWKIGATRDKFFEFLLPFWEDVAENVCKIILWFNWNSPNDHWQFAVHSDDVQDVQIISVSFVNRSRDTRWFVAWFNYSSLLHNDHQSRPPALAFNSKLGILDQLARRKCLCSLPFGVENFALGNEFNMLKFDCWLKFWILKLIASLAQYRPCHVTWQGSIGSHWAEVFWR